METTGQNNLHQRDFSSISPSAKTLLLLKGLTNIPFARKAAELISEPDKYSPDYTNKNLAFWARVVHFESRYWSIDQLLKDLPIKNMLELSSGFSFRGLEMIKQEGFHYIDTDLPDVITIKKGLVASLQNDQPHATSKLEILPLNALDEDQFTEIVSRFPEGEIVIINEGLLMYLGEPEKERLCAIIHKILHLRGGYWITADIYVKKELDKLRLSFDKKTTDFFAQHRIEENKFESFETARSFFLKAGFMIDEEAKTDRSKLSTLKYLLRSTSLWKLFKLRKANRMQVSWRLKLR